MDAPDEVAEGTEAPDDRLPSEHRLDRRSMLARYVFAAAAALVATLAILALEPVLTEPIYAVLVGAVAVTVWYGGFGPGLTVVAVGWSVSFFLFVVDAPGRDLDRADELVRWATALVVGLAVVWVNLVMRIGRERAATAAVTAEESIREMTRLRDLAAAVSAAVTPSDVAHAVVELLPGLLGARGGSLAVIDGDELMVVDSQGVPAQTHRPGLRMPLTARAPIAQVIARREGISVPDRITFERDYPYGAGLTPYANAVLAAPLRSPTGQVVGSMSFLYDDPANATDEAATILTIAADLAAQAIERARLYESEHESRLALDRILRISPSFYAESAEAVTDAICREARVAFGANLAMLWHLRDGSLELVCADPAQAWLPPGLVAPLDDFPELRDSVGNLQVSFVPDVQREAQGEGLERVRRLGIHSSLRMPVVIAGKTEHLVTVSWETVVSAPDPSTLLLARRLSDQAGLALEQLERRRAEAEATAFADETRRLQEVTAALSLAASAADVGDTCLEHALKAVGADAGYVVLSRAGALAVEMVSSFGFDEPELAVWRGFDLEADIPVSRAFKTGEPVWALTVEEVAAFTALEEHSDACWIALPLKTSAGVQGVLHLSFRNARTLSDGERQWLQTVVSQCAQALERSLLFDEEQRLRERSEQLQEITGQLSNALTRLDVADVVLAGIEGTTGADGAALAIVQEERQLLRTIAFRGYDEDVVDAFMETSLDADEPGAHAVRGRVPDFFGSAEELHAAFPRVAAPARGGHDSFFFVPLVAGRRVNGLLTISWEQPRTLSADDRRFVISLAGQAAQALDRASTYESEQTIAATLQRSVLPATLPRVEGVNLAARYLPGTADLNVGGDWFDALLLRDGRIGLVVGDVVGKGVQAAASMAQLRNGLRAFSLDRTKPSSTVNRLGQLAEEVLDTAFATMVYAVIDPAALVCRYTSAGHPPPLVVHGDGSVELLEGGRGLPLGTGSVSRYPQDVVALESGSLLVLYTDGLVERRGSSIDDGLAELQEAAREGPRDPESLLEHILERLGGSGEREDDIALLAARVFAVAPAPLRLQLPSDSGALDLVRDALRAWLEGAPSERTEAEEIVLATWEACANAIEHGADEDGATVRVSASLEDSVVRVAVEDTGGWKEPAGRPDRGLGLRLIHSLMSSVEVAAADGGTRVTFEKTLGRA